ncbi:MAG: metal-sulfur cluster assembly factor [Nigerium sp.]|nr:metal-sulfur cluster assembly factor [Nigerium sp.]
MTDQPRPSDLVKDTFPDAPAAAAGAEPVQVAAIEDVEEAMREVVDPELMVNVVDLGLVYGIRVDEQNHATIDMTLTSPTCPLTDRLEYDTHAALAPLVDAVTINWVWLPPWTLDNITDDGREQLRSIGYNL